MTDLTALTGRVDVAKMILHRQSLCAGVVSSCQQLPRVGPGLPPLFPLSIYFLIFCSFLLFFFFIGFTYFLILFIPSFSTRIVPLSFQAGDRRK